MIERLKTLIEFQRLGSMSLVADALRVTQPTVSKRLSQLEAELGVKLLRISGRRQTLTREALMIIEKSKPLISELKSFEGLSLKASSGGQRHIEIGVSDSVLGSWGAESFAEIQNQSPGIEISLHAHRGPRVVALVESGDYQLGLVAGQFARSGGLVDQVVAKEEMVLTGSVSSKTIITSEESSLTWNEVKLQVLSQGYSVGKRLESFFAVAQLAKAQMAAGLVPIGVAKALRGDPKWGHKGLRPKVHRTVRLIGRKSTLHDPDVKSLISELGQSIRKSLRAKPG